MFINDIIIYELQTSLDKRLNNLGQQGQQLDQLIDTHHNNIQNQQMMQMPPQPPSQLPFINNKPKKKHTKIIKNLNKIRDFLLDTKKPLASN